MSSAHGGKRKFMKCISMKQPWAWAVFHGKDIENRTWKTDFRGEILIHASRNVDPAGFLWLQRNFPELHADRQNLQFGAIIGKVKLIDCVTYSESPWFFGSYGFVLTNPVLFKNAIPYKGSLNLFDVPEELIEYGIGKSGESPGKRKINEPE